MGIDEDVELILAILLVVGSLPFVMAWLERTLDQPGESDHRRRRRLQWHRSR